MKTLFLNKFKNLLKKSNACTCNCSNSILKEQNPADEFDLDIIWDDVSSDNILVSAMRRHGIHGYPTNCLIVLEDGSEYIPEELSDHWDAYNSSEKFKPKLIKYKKL